MELELLITETKSVGRWCCSQCSVENMVGLLLMMILLGCWLYKCFDELYVEML